MLMSSWWNYWQTHTDVCVGTRDCSGLCCCCCCCNKHTTLTSDNAVPRQPAPSLPPTSVLLPTPPSPFSPPHQLAPRVDTRRPMNYTPRTARRMPALRLMTSLVVSRTSVRSGSTLAGTNGDERSTRKIFDDVTCRYRWRHGARVGAPRLAATKIAAAAAAAAVAVAVAAALPRQRSRNAIRRRRRASVCRSGDCVVLFVECHAIPGNMSLVTRHVVASTCGLPRRETTGEARALAVSQSPSPILV